MPAEAKNAENPLEAFEAMAEEFHRDTGYMHPGKDAPVGCGYTYDESVGAFRAWQRMREKHAKDKAALVEALTKIAKYIDLHPVYTPELDYIEYLTREALAQSSTK